MSTGKIIVPIILLLAAVGIGLLLLVPEFDRFQLIRNDTAALEEIGAEMDALITKRNQLAERANSISHEDMEKLDQAVPDGAHGPEFLVALEEMAHRHGMTIKRLDLGRNIQVKGRGATPTPAPVPITGVSGEGATVEVEPQVINTLPVSVSVRGPYDQFKSFLREVETYIRISNINNLSFVLNPESVSDLDVSAKMETYYE